MNMKVDAVIITEELPERCKDCRFLKFPSIISSYPDGGECTINVKYIHNCQTCDRPKWCPLTTESEYREKCFAELDRTIDGKPNETYTANIKYRLAGEATQPIRIKPNWLKRLEEEN